MGSHVYAVERVSVSWKEIFAGDLTQPNRTRMHAYDTKENKQSLTHTRTHAKHNEKSWSNSRKYFALVAEKEGQWLMRTKGDMSKSLHLFHYKNIPIFNNISILEGMDFHIIISQLLYHTAHIDSAN